MSDRKAEIYALLDNSRHNLRKLLDGLQSADWEKQVQEGDNFWTVRQMVSHLADAQRGMTGQISNISVDKDVIPADFDLDRWNKRAVEKFAEKTPEELLVMLEEGQVNLKQVLAGLSDEQLDKRGRHSSLEIMSVEEIARLIGTHEAEHTKIIADSLGDYSPE
jgi:uncharacterized damage-inducible protein DinB